MTQPSAARGDQWTFLTNHARVLITLARDPDSRLRDVADAVGITERAVQLIVADLEAAGYLTRTRVGRRNRYTIDPTVALRHPAEADHPVGDLLTTFLHREDAPAADTERAAAS
ncbi:helix-turn-helix transcriptional regulator [Streptomyces sp. NPDC058739]|uniref:helix-turn-helix transcriptional regulator n=1 Tax=Streptomyces sp. NPDC058739 TaxID=3346618 RepID=UPI0036835E3E